ncbi:MAG: HINT domain-containing protein, partial [Planctomycetaceae bacterium]|nr:HINT domain-containing protein [Planctomycetaceae bacterium]
DLSRAAQEIVSEDGTILYHENIGVTEHGYWVEAKDLRVGDVFIGANGELSILVLTERVEFPEGITVYNFTVDGNHDYFVIAQEYKYGQTCILVHNANYRFIVDSKGNIVDTVATPPGSYKQPNGGRTDILQRENHGVGLSHTHQPIVNRKSETGEIFINGLNHGSPVSPEDVKNIMNGIAKRTRKGR